MIDKTTRKFLYRSEIVIKPISCNHTLKKYNLDAIDS